MLYHLFDHVRTRVAIWQDPWDSPQGSGYQIIQSLISIASGGLTGMGLGLGSPDIVPVAESDFIFSAICEEFGILVGLGIMGVQRNSALSSDTIIGVFFSAVMAFGLAVVSRDNAVARDLQQFLYGDILTITETDIRWLIGLFFALAAFQIWGYNRLLYIGLNSVVAKAHRINVFFWQYLFAGLLALVVMFSVWAVGVLLVTALLIVPAATARNLARTAGGMFWWSILVSVTSAVAGLVLSAQEWAGTATGATVVLVSCGWFLLSAVLAAIRGEGRRQ